MPTIYCYSHMCSLMKPCAQRRKSMTISVKRYFNLVPVAYIIRISIEPFWNFIIYENTFHILKSTNKFCLYIFTQFDEALCAEAEVYAKQRQAQNIAPMEVLQVKPGTFKQLGNSIQFKVPRVVRQRDMLAFFTQNLL